MSAAISLASRAAEADEVEQVAIAYTGLPDCPSEDAFVGEIAARTPKLKRATPADAARSMRVTIARAKDRTFTGELRLLEGAEEAVREVRADRCEVVVSALALIAALAIDPSASTAALPPTPASEPLPPPPAPPPPAAPSPPPPPAAAPGDGLPPPTARRTASFGAAVGAALRSGIVPTSSAFTLAAIASLPPLWKIEPQARVELALGLPRTEDTGGPAAELRWIGGHLEGCALRSPGTASAWSAGPCAVVEIGGLHARANETRVRDAQTVTRLSAGGGVGLRGALRAGRFYGDVGAFVLVPFRRDRFYVDPNITLFEPSVVGVQLGTAVGLLF